MRIFISIVLFLAGAGSIVYSYVGSLVALAGDVERSLQAEDALSAFARIVGFLLRGELPQMTRFLYVGVLLIAVAIVNLIVKGGSGDERDPS